MESFLMRPLKVSTIPERTGTSYKRSQILRNLTTSLINKPKKNKNLRMTQTKQSHNSNYVTIYFLISSSHCVV